VIVKKVPRVGGNMIGTSNKFEMTLPKMALTTNDLVQRWPNESSRFLVSAKRGGFQHNTGRMASNGINCCDDG